MIAAGLPFIAIGYGAFLCDAFGSFRCRKVEQVVREVMAAYMVGDRLRIEVKDKDDEQGSPGTQH